MKPKSMLILASDGGPFKNTGNPWRKDAGTK
jgi:hypothetical protein